MRQNREKLPRTAYYGREQSQLRHVFVTATIVRVVLLALQFSPM